MSIEAIELQIPPRRRRVADTSPREGSVIETIKRRAKKLKAEGIPLKLEKTHGGAWGKAGRPDLHVTVGGLSGWLEVKRSAKEKPTDLQKAELRGWGEAGAVTGVIWTADQFEDVVRQMDQRRLLLLKALGEMLGVDPRHLYGLAFAPDGK